MGKRDFEIAAFWHHTAFDIKTKTMEDFITLITPLGIHICNYVFVIGN